MILLTQQKLVFNLTFCQGCTLEEIAEKLKLSPCERIKSVSYLFQTSSFLLTASTLKTHHYLTSGILEAYLLGLVAEKEKEELEQVLATDPDVFAQLNELEATMEDYFLTNAVPPPPSIREKIELRISGTEIKKWEEVDQTNANPKSEKSQSPYIDVEVNDTYIQVHKYWRTAFIAVFILSKVFLILGLYYYFKSSSLEQEVNRLKSATQQASPLPR